MHRWMAIALCVLIGLVCYRKARERGRNPYAWLLAGLSFGALGLITLMLLPRLTGTKQPPLPKEASVPMLRPTNPAHADKLWYYLDGADQQQGPLSLQALNRVYHEGKISAKSYIWNECLEHWHPLENYLTTS